MALASAEEGPQRLRRCAERREIDGPAGILLHEAVSSISAFRVRATTSQSLPFQTIVARCLEAVRCHRPHQISLAGRLYIYRF